MADKIDPKKTALVVQCMQRDFVEVKATAVNLVPSMLERKGTIPKVQKLVAAARRVGMPIIFIGHLKRPDGKDLLSTLESDVKLHIQFLYEGTPGADFIAGLQPTPADHVVYKRRFSAFYGTDLDIRLKALGVDTLIFTGLLTNVSIANTIAAAHDRDLDLYVVSDCVACGFPEHDEFFLTRTFPAVARVRTAEEMLAVMAGT
ncbi:MAG: cysteine hydrolase [Chloroflexi bacterium]|nr:cysteine hydrolase [Chloroflexota bacterium]